MDKTTIITLEKLARFANNANDKFVAKEDGKTLSTNDFTNDQKAKLESLENYVLPQASADVAGGVKIGAGLSITSDGILSATGGGTADAVEWDNVVGKPDDLLQAGDVYSKEEIDSKVNGVYSKEEIDAKVENLYSKEEIDAKVNAVYKFKGSVDGLVALPAENNVVGDVYNLKDTGMNVAWDGTQWDYLGVDVDLSGYVQAKDLVEATDEQIDALFA